MGEDKIEKPNEEHDEDCVEEVFQLPRVKFDEGGRGDMVRDSEGGREALGMGNRSINIWDG